MNENDQPPLEQPPFADLVQHAYDELRGIARGQIANERPGHTLQPTALVHEAIVRLQASPSPWSDHAAFVRAAVSAMRRVLIDHARARHADKRGGRRQPINVTFSGIADMDLGQEVLALNDALTKLESLDERRARVAELRLFGGFENKRIAELLDISTSTASDDWSIARAWLLADLKDTDE